MYGFGSWLASCSASASGCVMIFEPSFLDLKVLVSESCSQVQGKCLLHARSHLSLSTRFSGMGGAEMSAFLAGAHLNVRFHLLSQCDVLSEAFSDPHHHSCEMHRTSAPLCIKRCRATDVLRHCASVLCTTTRCVNSRTIRRCSQRMHGQGCWKRRSTRTNWRSCGKAC